MSRVSSGHVLSETAGACDPILGKPLNSLPPSGGAPGASIDGEDRVLSNRFWRFGGFGSNLLSGGGLYARLRGQAQVAVSRTSTGRGVACAVGGDTRQPELAPWIERKKKKLSRRFMTSFRRRLWSSWRIIQA